MTLREIATQVVQGAITNIPEEAEIYQVTAEEDGARGGITGMVRFFYRERGYILMGNNSAAGTHWAIKTAEGLPATLGES